MELLPESLVPELAPPPSPPPNPASRAEESDAPDPRALDLAQSVKVIHAMQAGMFPFFILYIFMSIVIAVIASNGLLAGISLCGLIVPFIGKLAEKRAPESIHMLRLISIVVLFIETGLFFAWQSIVFFLFH